MKRNRRKGVHPQVGKRPTLSLCMIVKNEEANLGRCLESVKGVADEIIVVDTGSTDRTVEIARQHDARIFSHPWSDDFAAARNVSLSHATSDWILVLDADEALAPEDRAPLRKLLHRDGPTAYSLNIVSPVDDRRSSHAVINAFPRLFRRLPDLRFEGRCHEQLFPSIARIGGTVRPSEIRVHHRGYHSRWADMPAKRGRNLRLLHKQLDEHPNDPLAHFHLGEVHALEGRFVEAVGCYRKALSLPGLPPTNRSVTRRSLASCLIKVGQFSEAWEESRRACEDDPRYAMPHLTGAIALGKLKQYDAAIEQVELYLAQATRRGRGIQGILDHEPNLAFAWSFKGECCLALRQLERAENCFRTALAHQPDFPEAHLGMGKVYKITGRPRQAAQAFEKATLLFQELPHGHLALAKAYAEQERWDAAAAACERFLEACPQEMAGLELYAQALLKLKRLREAEAAYRSLVAHAPSGLAYFALACLADARGDRTDATAWCRKAWELEQTDPRIPFLLGCCLIDAGQYREALAVLLEAERLAPGTPEIEVRLKLLARLADTTPSLQKRGWCTPLSPPLQKGGRGVAGDGRSPPPGQAIGRCTMNAER